MSDKYEVVVDLTNPAQGTITLRPEWFDGRKYDDLGKANKRAAEFVFGNGEPLTVAVRDVKGQQIKTRWTLSASNEVTYERLVLPGPAIRHERPPTFEEFCKLFSLANAG